MVDVQMEELLKEVALSEHRKKLVDSFVQEVTASLQSVPESEVVEVRNLWSVYIIISSVASALILTDSLVAVNIIFLLAFSFSLVGWSFMVARRGSPIPLRPAGIKRQISHGASCINRRGGQLSNGDLYQTQSHCGLGSHYSSCKLFMQHISFSVCLSIYISIHLAYI